MDLFFSMVNAGTCGLISLALIGCVLSPRVHDGVVIKVGLISMALGFGALALLMVTGPYDAAAFIRALVLVCAGIAVVIVGYLMRASNARHALRRITDWGDFDPRAHQPDDRTTPP